MRPSERFAVWWGLSLYYKWELFGVWLRLRCSACGDWYWNDDPCFADGHDAKREGHPR